MAPDRGARAGMPQDLLKDFNALARKYRPYWPPAASALAAERRAPRAMRWATACALREPGRPMPTPVIARLQGAEAEAAELELAAAALREIAESHIDFAALARADHGVTAALFALPLGVEIELPQDTITRFAALASERLLLAIGAPEDIEAIGRAVAEVNGRRARFPDWLQPSAAANLSLVADKFCRTEGDRPVAGRTRGRLRAARAGPCAR